MAHTISIHLSLAAQSAAILAGQPAHTPQAHEVPAPLLARLLALPWTRIEPSGEARCEVPAVLRHDASWDLSTYSGYGTVPGAGVGAAIRRPTNAEEAIEHAESCLATARVYLAERAEHQRAERAERESREAAKRAEVAARVAAWAALPLAARILVASETVSALAGVSWDEARAHARPVADETETECRRIADALREARERPRTEALKQVAARSRFARAAQEGYDVERVALDHLAAEVRDQIASRSTTAVLAVDEDWWRVVRERPAPSAEVLALRDAAVEAVAAVPLLDPAIGTWEVSRAMRVDVEPRTGFERWITAILVTLRDPSGDCERQITCSLESQDPESEEES
jgi:hypothetical protein